VVSELQFSPEFRFGVADADLQVIGERNTIEHEGSAETMWHHFARRSQKCHNRESPAEGVDRYHLWRSDIALILELGIRDYRTSVSMSRVLHSDGSINKKAIEWYRQYFQALREAGVRIYVTLYHWELPQYLHEIGGWKNRRTTEVFLQHALAVYEELGDLIEEYFVLNEPWCSSLLSYHLGIHAPGETDLQGALLAAHHLLIAQGMVVSELSARDPHLKIGTVLNTETAYAASTSPVDIAAAGRANGYFNTWFFDPIFLGRYPENMLEWYGAKAPSAGPRDMDLIRVGSRLHALGVNFYAGTTVIFDEQDERGYRAVSYPDRPKNDLNWPVYVPPTYPEAFYDILTQVYFSYRSHGLKRMYVTENGFAQSSPWDGSSLIVEDGRRVEYFRDHLRQLHKAITRGIPVDGYFLWTLMDNYEWAEGYRPESCFGIYHVDRKTLRRVKKRSAVFYEQIVRSRKLQLVS
jgi:beta-glucosidase